MALGCAVHPPNLKMPEDLPPIIKEYKHINLYPEVYTTTGIYLDKNQHFTILATGKIRIDPILSHLAYNEAILTPKNGYPLVARIENNRYFQPLLMEQYGVNGITLPAQDTGTLYLCINLVGPLYGSGESFELVDLGDSGPSCHYLTGYFSVDIVVWKTQDPSQIIGFLKKMKDEAIKSGAKPESVDAITDAMDTAGHLTKW
jgi:hypothetical protein